MFIQERYSGKRAFCTSYVIFTIILFFISFINPCLVPTSCAQTDSQNSSKGNVDIIGIDSILNKSDVEDKSRTNEIVVGLKLADLPPELEFNGGNPVGEEYAWSAFVDIDNDKNTGSIHDGSDVWISLIYFHKNGVDPYYDSIENATRKVVYIYNDERNFWSSQSVSIKSEVDYQNKTIRLSIPITGNLDTIDESDEYYFKATYSAHGLCYDTTDTSNGGDLIEDPLGDVPYGFIDIVQGYLKVNSETATSNFTGVGFKNVLTVLNGGPDSAGKEESEHHSVVESKHSSGTMALETEDGGYIVLGRLFEYPSDNLVINSSESISGTVIINTSYFVAEQESRDILLMKTNSDGCDEWNRTFGGDGWDQGYSIQTTGDGDYIISGLTKSHGTKGSDGLSSPDVWLIKTDSEGNELWNKTFGGPKFDAGYFAQETPSGGYFAVGVTGSYGSDNMDAWIIKTDSEGNEEWNRTIEDKTIRGDDNPALVTDDGEYVVIVNKESSVGAFGSDAMLIKIDPDGNEMWSTKFGGTGDQYGRFVRASEDGGYVVGGYGTSMTKPWLAKTNSEGKKVWEWDLNDRFNLDPKKRLFKTKDGSYIRHVSNKIDPSYELDDFQETRDGSYIILAENAANDVYLAKVNPNGTEEWNNTYSRYDIRSGNSVLETSDGGYLITGEESSDLCLMKTDSEGAKEWNRIFLATPDGLEINTKKRSRF